MVDQLDLQFGKGSVEYLWEWFKNVYNPSTDYFGYKRKLVDVLDSISEAYGEESVSTARSFAIELGVLDANVFPISSPSPSVFGLDEPIETTVRFSCDKTISEE